MDQKPMSNTTKIVRLMRLERIHEQLKSLLIAQRKEAEALCTATEYRVGNINRELDVLKAQLEADVEELGELLEKAKQAGKLTIAERA